jgi:hypothetical protein
MALKGIGREIRRCTAFIPGTARRCKKFAIANSNLCNFHRPIEITDEEDKQLEKELQKLGLASLKKKYLCPCSAYPFPHQPGKGNGLCLWPDPPEFRYVWPKKNSLDPSPKGGIEKEVKKILRNLGVKSKLTGYSHVFLKARKEKIPKEDLTLQDFTLLEDYLKEYKPTFDWSSLPLDQKRKYLKEQMVKELRKEVERKEAYKPKKFSLEDLDLEWEGESFEKEIGANLKKEDNLTTIVVKEDLPNTSPSRKQRLNSSHSFPIVKQKVRLRNGQIEERLFMILENGERIPLD